MRQQLKTCVIAVVAAFLALPTWAASKRYFTKNGGDVSVSGNFNGKGNVYFQGGYNGAYSGYLPEGSAFSSSVIVYVFDGFTLDIQGGTFDALFANKEGATNPSLTIGKGIVNQSGGTVNVGPVSPSTDTRTLCLAYSGNGHAQYNLSGGTLNVRGDSLLMVRSTSPATFTQTGGVLDLSGGCGQAVLLGESGSGTATVNLQGGVAKVGRFYSNIEAASYLNFDGGTVQPLADSAEFIGSASDSKGLNVRVLARGAIFDVAYDVVACLPFASGVSASDLDGGLIKKGEGVLTLAAGNTYTGPTKIEAGALKVAKGAEFSGTLVIEKGGQLVIDGVGDADVGQTVVTFAGGITLAEGVTAADAFASGTELFRTFEISADGKSLVVREMSADTELTADWKRANADYVFPDSIDLKGHTLRVRQPANTGNLTITDSSAAGSGGTLVLCIPTGMTVSNSTVSLTGSLLLETTGGGTYVPTISQTYTGGTTIGSRLKTETAVYFGDIPAGADKRIVRILPTGILDLFGLSGYYSATRFVLAGGALRNDGVDIGSATRNGEYGGVAALVDVELEADSQIGGNTIPILSGNYKATYLNLNGHKLTVKMNDGKRLYLCKTAVSGGGTIEVASGYLVVGGYTTDGDTRGAAISMPETSLVQSGTGGVRLLHNLEVLDYTCTATGSWSPLSGTLTVNGKLAPVTDKFVKTTLKAGGSIDVSAATGPIALVSAISNQGSPTLPSSVLVTTGARELADGDKVLSWSNDPYENVAFTDDPAMQEKELTFEKRSDGLYVRSSVGPHFATYDVEGEEWKFFSEDGTPMTEWTQGVTADIWVHFASDTEYQAIRTAGTAGRGLILTGTSLPQNETSATYDWSEYGFTMSNNATFDLNGNTLVVPASLLTDNSTAHSFGSSVSGGTVRCCFDANATVSTTAIGSGVTLVKEGAGTLVWAHNDVNGLCTVAAGTLKGGVNNGLFATLTVEKDATFDFNGTYNHAAMKIVSNGGRLTCTGTAISWNNVTFSELEITDDTMINVAVGGNHSGGQCTGWGLNGNQKKVTLNGKTLTINIGSGAVFWLFGTTFTDAGTLEFKDGGYLCLHSDTVNAAQVTLNHEGGCFIINQQVNVSNYVVNLATRDSSSYGTNTFCVSGVFAPNQDCYMNTRMLDGSTLDLSRRTTPLSLQGTVSRGQTRHLTFAENATIYVDLGERRPERDEKLIEWTASTKPSNLRFKLALGSKQNGCFCICDDGLYFRSGFAIYIAQNEEPIFVPEAFFDGKTVGDAPITTETLAQAYMGTRGTDPSEYVGVNMSLTHDKGVKGQTPSQTETRRYNHGAPSKLG